MALLRADLPAGLTVALVAIPQCMAFATLAGLPPVSGLYAAVVMGLIGAAISNCPKLVIGPAVTTSIMLLAVLRTVAPGQPDDWPAIAGFVAVLVGAMTLVAAVMNVGRAVRFVSRSVIVGLVTGSAILIVASQLASALGVPAGGEPTLVGMLWTTLRRSGETSAAASLMAAATLVFVFVGSRLGPRFPGPFLALVLGGVATWWLDSRGAATGLQTIGELSWRWPPRPAPVFGVSYTTDLIAGATAICLVGIIQNLAIAKALAARADDRLEAKRELLALGAANVASGFLHGFPGSASFARSALSDLSGARTRVSGLVAAVATALIAALAAPLARYISMAAIAGLLMATAISIVDWKELGHVLTRDRHDRVVLGTTIGCVFFLPIHWAILIGLAVSIAVFLRRVSRLHLVEMVRGQDGPFQEQDIDFQTGGSAIAMLQVEGPLFFAHADEISETLRTILGRGPRVTIVRMRRTQQIDFSVIAALERVIRPYRASGGRIVICGLTPELRHTLLESPLGEAVGSDFLLETTREVFGSAHMAIGLAEAIVDVEPDDTRPRFRVAGRPQPR